MGRKAVVLFWGAATAAVFFLGSVWTAAGNLGSGPHELANAVVVSVAVIGFVGTAVVAGRIAFVVGRTQRHTRRMRSGEPVPTPEQEV